MADKELLMGSHMFDFIYMEAMDDATRRTGAASIKKTVLKDKTVKNLVKEYASLVIAGNNPLFNDYENKIENRLQKSGIKKFTFGNIQKLINMTMKYLYIRYYNRPEAVNFSCCDAPMDTSMRDYVYVKMIKKNKTPDFIKDCAWSKFKRKETRRKYSCTNYDGYQAAIDELRGDLSRLDYEIINYDKAKLK